MKEEEEKALRTVLKYLDDARATFWLFSRTSEGVTCTQQFSHFEGCVRRSSNWAGVYRLPELSRHFKMQKRSRQCSYIAAIRVDWDEACCDDWEESERALIEGARLFSVTEQQTA
jgi:hypothetical protein